MPARTRRRRRIATKKAIRTQKRSKSKKQSKLKYVLLLIFVSIIVLLYLLLSFSTKSWDGESKINIACWDGKEVKVVVFDPSAGEITEVVVPADTEVSTARNLGNWRLGSVWELGEQENLSGKLLSETITSYLKIPADHWWSGSLGTILDRGVISSTITAFSAVGDTDLGIGDRLHLALFASRVGNNDRSVIDLADSTYLAEKELTDGNPGHVVEGKIPKNLLLLFADNYLASTRTTTLIVDKSGTYDTARDLGQVLEVIGTKVGSISKEDASDMECSVSGKDKNVINRIANIFDCETGGHGDNTNFDIVITVGEGFADRF